MGPLASSPRKAHEAAQKSPGRASSFFLHGSLKHHSDSFQGVATPIINYMYGLAPDLFLTPLDAPSPASVAANAKRQVRTSGLRIQRTKGRNLPTAPFPSPTPHEERKASDLESCTLQTPNPAHKIRDAGPRFCAQDPRPSETLGLP